MLVMALDGGKSPARAVCVQAAGRRAMPDSGRHAIDPAAPGRLRRLDESIVGPRLS